MLLQHSPYKKQYTPPIQYRITGSPIQLQNHQYNNYTKSQIQINLTKWETQKRSENTRLNMKNTVKIPNSETQCNQRVYAFNYYKILYLYKGGEREGIKRERTQRVADARVTNANIVNAGVVLRGYHRYEGHVSWGIWMRAWIPRPTATRDVKERKKQNKEKDRVEETE